MACYRVVFRDVHCQIGLHIQVEDGEDVDKCVPLPRIEHLNHHRNMILLEILLLLTTISDRRASPQTSHVLFEHVSDH